MIKFYKDSGATQRLRQEVGRLSGDGSIKTFVCSEDPQHIRVFSTAKYWGELLTSGTGYTYNSGTKTVTLTATPTASETVVAISQGDYLFEDSYVIGNSSVNSNRIITKQVYVKVTGVNSRDVMVKIADYVGAAGLSVSYYSLSNNGSTWPGANNEISLGDIANNEIKSFHVKVEIPQGVAMDNYHDVYLFTQSKDFNIHL
jgi:hypothetical protein